MTPSAPRRVAVAGASGSGKTTLAAELGLVLGVSHVEIDGLYHHAGWTANPRFAEEVRSFVAREAWTTEWQYDIGRPLIAARAELIVWLDPPRMVVLGRVVRRTLRRRLRRIELWHGNLEPPLRTILTDPDHIVRWSWRSYPLVRPRLRAALVEHPGLRVVRIRTERDRRRLLRRLATATR